MEYCSVNFGGDNTLEWLRIGEVILLFVPEYNIFILIIIIWSNELHLLPIVI